MLEIFGTCLFFAFSIWPKTRKIWNYKIPIKKIPLEDFHLSIESFSTGILLAIPALFIRDMIINNFWAGKGSILLARVNDTYSAAHTLVWIPILLVFYVFYFGEKNILKACLLTAGMICLHESYWNLFYTATITYNQLEGGYLPSYLVTWIFLLTVLIIYGITFKKLALRIALIVLPILTIYFSYWLSLGFPVSLSSLSKTGTITIFYNSIFVAKLEIASWTIASLSTLAAYLFVKFVWQKHDNFWAVKLLRMAKAR